jgi:O-antigen biosynthesis protein
VKIASIMVQPNGCAYYRQALPMRSLARAGHDVALVDYHTARTSAIAAADVIHLGRLKGPAALSSVQRAQAEGKTVIVDYDDDLLNLPAHNSATGTYTEHDVTSILRQADGITVTSEALASVYRPYARRIAVLPNYVDVADWPAPEPRASITVGIAGGESHVEDWRLVAEPMQRIRAELPDVRFLVIGFNPDYLPATERISWLPVDQYQRTVSRIDIGLCPLVDDSFNRRKTPIKAYEYGLAGAAVVGSPTLYRTTLQGRGIIARTPDDWYEGVKAYITDPRRRTRDAAALHAFVERLDVYRHAAEIYRAFATIHKDAKWTPSPRRAPHLVSRGK